MAPNAARARPAAVVLGLTAALLASGGAAHEWHSLWLVRRTAVSRAMWPPPDAIDDAAACAPLDVLSGWTYARLDGRREELAVEHWWEQGASVDELPPISPAGWQRVDPGAPLLEGECHRRERTHLDRLVVALALWSSRDASPDACLASMVRAISVLRVPAGPEDHSASIDRGRAFERLGREAMRCAAQASPEARDEAASTLGALAQRRGSLDDTLQMLGHGWAGELMRNIDDALRPRGRGDHRPLYALHRYASLRALLRSRPPRERCAPLDDAACARAMRTIAWPVASLHEARKRIEAAEGERRRLEQLARDVGHEGSRRADRTR